MSPAAPDSPLPGFVARSARTIRLAEMAARAAARASVVLVTGESGAGKSRLARCLHEAARPGAPFVTVDCGSLSEELAENELFGHEAGAYSGALARQAGKFEAADGGTVLLDRVCDLAPSVQGKLLRVLQERTFERVGGQASVRVDVLVVATATRDLGELVRQGSFREDLLYRLDVIRLDVPPLRDRPEDVPALAEAFLEQQSVRLGRRLRLDEAAVQALARRPWPGNVRELQNVLERAAVRAAGELVGPQDLEEPSPPQDAPDRAVAEIARRRLPLHELERLYIARVLGDAGGRIGRAAAVLGIHRKTLLEKRKRYGLD